MVDTYDTGGLGFLKLNTDRLVFRMLYCVMMLGCFSLLFYLPYIYGDVLSISFGIILFYGVAAQNIPAEEIYCIGILRAAKGTCPEKYMDRSRCRAVYVLLVSPEKRKYDIFMAGTAILLTAKIVREGSRCNL